MLGQRVLTAAIALSLFLAALFYLPNLWWSVLMAGLLFIGGDEWSRLARFDPVRRFVFLISLAIVCGVLMAIPNGGAERWIYCASLLFWCIAAPCWLRFKWGTTPAMLLIAGIIVLLPTWLALARLQQEPLRLLALLAVVWIADTAAFFTGKLFGKHKLAPSISPGKTWEGVAGAMVAVALYAWMVSAMESGHSIEVITGLFLAMTVLSILGDLFESWLKRAAGVKDSSNLLPGHGGILDRIDGVTAALPLAALLYLGGMA